MSFFCCSSFFFFLCIQQQQWKRRKQSTGFLLLTLLGGQLVAHLARVAAGRRDRGGGGQRGWLSLVAGSVLLLDGAFRGRATKGRKEALARRGLAAAPLGSLWCGRRRSTRRSPAVQQSPHGTQQGLGDRSSPRFTILYRVGAWCRNGGRRSVHIIIVVVWNVDDDPIDPAVALRRAASSGPPDRCALAAGAA